MALRPHKLGEALSMEIQEMLDADFKSWLTDFKRQSGVLVSQLLEDHTALHFLIAWALFKSLCFNNSVNIKNIQRFSERTDEGGSFDVTSIHEDVKHFHTRYQDRDKFRNLIFDNKDYADIETILNCRVDDVTSKQMIYLSVFVIFRYRNNIFHGNKGIESWLNFREQIARCTRIMQKFVSHESHHNPPSARTFRNT